MLTPVAPHSGPLCGVVIGPAQSNMQAQDVKPVVIDVKKRVDPVAMAKSMDDSRIASFAAQGGVKSLVLVYAAQVGLRTVPATVVTLLRTLRSLLGVITASQRPSAALASVVADFSALIRRLGSTLSNSLPQLRLAMFLGSVVLFTRLIVARARRTHGLAIEDGDDSVAAAGGGTKSATPRATLAPKRAWRTALLAGVAASGSLLLVPRESRLGLALFVGVRAAEVGCTQLCSAGYLPRVPYPHMWVMAASSAEIVYSLVFEPTALEPGTPPTTAPVAARRVWRVWHAFSLCILWCTVPTV